MVNSQRIMAYKAQRQILIKLYIIAKLSPAIAIVLYFIVITPTHIMVLSTVIMGPRVTSPDKHEFIQILTYY